MLTPDRMISKALIKLTTNDPFFGCVAMRLNMEAVDQKFIAKFEQARGYPFTIATDGKAIRYNPEWVAKQQIGDLVGVLAHEAAHVALKHNLRRGERDINGWNIACDLAINPHLFDAGYSLPGFDDAKKASCAQYKEMSAEKIYGMIPKPPPDGGDGDGEPSPDQFNEAPKDPGGVLDHPKSNPKDQNQQRELEEQADGEIEAAYNAAKTQGSVPGWMDRVIKGRRKVLNDYRELLRDWMEKSLYKGDYSWSVPNRRYIQHGFCLPGFAPEDDTPSFIFVMDTSGSIDDDDEEEFASHINSVLEEFPADYTVIFTDTKVRGRQVVKHDELPIELKTTGGGGTNFIDVMNVIREEFVKSDDPPHGVIFFTDLCTERFGEDPGIPVLWLVHGGNTSPVPFGKVVHCKSKEEIEEERYK